MIFDIVWIEKEFYWRYVDTLLFRKIKEEGNGGYYLFLGNWELQEKPGKLEIIGNAYDCLRNIIDEADAGQRGDGN